MISLNQIICKTYLTIHGFILFCAGLEHSKNAPISNAFDNLLIESHGLALPRSKTEKKEIAKHDLRLDRLPEHEKVM